MIPIPQLPQLKYGRAALLLGLAVGFCVIAAAAWRSPSLLTAGAGQWIEYPHVARTNSRPERELVAVFTRELSEPLAGTEELELRCLGECAVPALSGGATTLRVEVSRKDGPPAMALALRDGGKLLLESDVSWLATLNGATPLGARLATRPERPPGSRLVARVEWAQLAALLLAAAAIAIAWQRAENHPAANGAIGLSIAGVWAVLLWKSAGIEPGFTGFDFAHHVHYVRFILERGALPLPTDGVQTYQPPLFYLLSALWLKLLGIATEAPGAPLALRTLTFVLGFAQLAGIVLCVRRVLPSRAEAAQLSAILVAALPVHLLMMHAFANEILLAALSTWTFVALLRCVQAAAPSASAAATLGALLGAALLSKLSALVLVPAVFVGLIAAHPKRFGLWLITAVAALLVSGGYYLKIAELYGTPFIGNWDAAVGFAWWQDPGLRSAGDYFRFGAVFSEPYYAGFSSVWDGFYSTLFADGLVSGTSERLLGPAWNDGLVRAAIALSLIPALTFMLGIGLGIVEVWKRPTARGLVFAAALTAMGAAFLAMTLRVPSYAQAKASYWSPVFSILVVAFALGADRIVQSLRVRSRFASGAYVAALLAWAFVSIAMLWIDEDAPRTLESRAERAFAVRAPDRALAYLAEVPSSATAPWVPVGRCRAAMLSGRNDAAAAECASALAAYPNDAGALFHSAQLARATGNRERALALLEEMAVVAPWDPRAAPGITALAAALGDSERAAESAREMLRFDPGSAKAMAALKELTKLTEPNTAVPRD